MAIQDFNDAELAAEIDRRAKERKRIEQEERGRFNALVLKHIDTLLALTKHGRLTCVEGRIVNEGRCAKCSLEQIKQDGWVSDNLKVEIEAIITHIAE